jgi:hypothetical protein
MQNHDENILGETDQIIDFESRLENRELAVAMTEQARQTIRILTVDLESPVYDHESFIQAITRLVKRSRNSTVQILVRDSAQAITHGHRLIECSRKFSSYIHLHNPSRDDEGFTNAFLVADESGYIYKQDATRYEGAANFKDTFRARELNEIFDGYWERSRPDPEMRRLFI